MDTIDCITYYDTGNISYASFYLAGLQTQAAIHGFRFTIERRLPRELRHCFADPVWQKLQPSVFLFKLERSNDASFFAIDMRDSGRFDSGDGYHLPVLDVVAAYFKANYDPEVVALEPLLARHRHKIVEITSPFPVQMPRPRQFQHWFASPLAQRRRLRELRALYSLDHFRSLRSKVPTLDAVFIMAHYGQAHHDAVAAMRFELVKALHDHPRLNVWTGLIGSEPLPEPFGSYQIDPLPRADYLLALAQSRVLIYVRGPHDAISFKFGEMMALGLPIVGQRLAYNRDTLYANPYFEEQFGYEDPQAIVDQTCALLADPDRAEVIAESNLEVFEESLTPAFAIAGILDVLLDGVRVTVGP